MGLYSDLMGFYSDSIGHEWDIYGIYPLVMTKLLKMAMEIVSLSIEPGDFP